MTTPPRSRQILGLAAWLGITCAAASIGALASAGSGGFYRSLLRPAWAPPAALFGPVWTVLYLLMGIAAWLIWRDFGFRGSRAALWLFLVQLALNALWTWLFFHWRLGALAFAEILLLGLAVLATLASFWRLRPIAGALLIPYLG
ncbi:MAG TPA: TspO/MBR family protein, partial [Holophaga sp.]|nr:TspO/MBR family protein [Holophaga sp.]